jgi:hypothetical protein
VVVGLPRLLPPSSLDLAKFQKRSRAASSTYGDSTRGGRSRTRSFELQLWVVQLWVVVVCLPLLAVYKVAGADISPPSSQTWQDVERKVAQLL